MKPGEHKTVQARIIKYAEAIGWTFVPRAEAERRRRFDPEAAHTERALGNSLFFEGILETKIREFNPRYAEAEGALLGTFGRLNTNIHGNREFVDYTLDYDFRSLTGDVTFKFSYTFRF